MADGKLVFAKEEYVEDNRIDELNKPSDYAVDATIQMKNGETIDREVNPAYPF